MESVKINIVDIVAAIGKKRSAFTKADIVKFMEKHGVRHVNFMYAGGDGRLKTLNFVVHSRAYLDEILSCGERVDGSSLFSYIEASSSDLYVMPRYSTAFMDPFAELPTLCLLCSFFNKDGERLESSPEYTLEKAVSAFKKETGMDFEAMGELEYYVIAPDTGAFPAVDQRGYHESAPFAKFGEFRQKCMLAIALAGGLIKYGHSEVGNFTENGLVYEQNEIEFLPASPVDAANQLTIAKWMIRNLGARYGFDITFAPKITVGKAGSGLHIHMRIMKNGVNQMLKNGRISDTAKRAIAGMMELAPSITAFGNRNPTSYLRLVPHQEAPTNVCWGDRNRSVLVRVPLGWSSKADMLGAVNPGEKASAGELRQKQTVEMRSPDASANVYLLMASLAVACRRGFEMKDAVAKADATYVNVNIHKKENAALLKTLATLPDSCWASACVLEKQRSAYEEKGVFSKAMIDGIAAELKAFDDRTLRAKLMKDKALLAKTVRTYFHCG